MPGNHICRRKRTVVRRSFEFLIPAVVACFWVPVHAQSYPAKPVRVIVPNAPGGSIDLFARNIAHKLTEAWERQVVVDNRGGAAGMIGGEAVARAAPDGYTLLITSLSPVAIVPHFMRKPLYDPQRDFVPVILIASAPLALVVHPSVPVNSVKELISLAKARPRELNYASGGNGTSMHLVMELFKLHANIDILHVPYKSGAHQVFGVVTGEASGLFSSMPLLFPHLRSGKLRALAVSSLQRVSIAPELPTIAETLPGFEASNWWGVFAPARTPVEIVEKLNADMGKILNHPDIKQSFATDGAAPRGGSPRDFAAFYKTEYEKWGTVVKRTGIRSD